MEVLLLILALLFLIWRIKSANDEAFPPTDGGGYFYKSPMQSDTSESTTQEVDDHTSSSFSSIKDDYGSRWHEDCDISRAMWDPSCPMYHVFHQDDWSTSSSWDS